MTDTEHKICISYKLSEFMEYSDINNVMPINLVSFCPEYGGDVVIRESLLKQTDMIISQYMSGKNPNDITFKNQLVEYLNKISYKTYDSMLELLKNLNYTTKEHFETLAYEIMLRAMQDTVVIKGIDVPDGQYTLSDVYADIAHEFSPLLIKTSTGDVKFVNVLMSMCSKYFNDFTDVTKPLDQNNQYRVDNFNGFMNFLGLLFNRGVVSHTIIYSCLQTLKTLMFNESWGTVETENVFNGYSKLITQILAISEKKNVKRTHIDITYVNKVKDLHWEIKTLNDKYSKLKKFNMMSHDKMNTRLGKLLAFVEKQ